MIAPGQREVFQAQVPTTGSVTQITKRISVTTNDRENPALSLECTGKVLSALAIEPRTVNFGQIARSAAEQRKTLVVRRGDGGPIHPTIEGTKHGNIKAELREIEPGEHYEIDVIAAPPWPNGTLRTNVTIATGVTEAPQETVTVVANIKPRLQANPARFTVSQNVTEPTDFAARLVWDEHPGKILEVSVTDEALQARLDERDGAAQVIVTVPPGYKPSSRAVQNVIVKTDDPELPELKIPIFINTRAAPRTPTAVGGNEVSEPTPRPRATGVAPTTQPGAGRRDATRVAPAAGMASTRPSE